MKSKSNKSNKSDDQTYDLGQAHPAEKVSFETLNQSIAEMRGTPKPAVMDYAAALAVVGNVEALAIIRRNAARGVSWANVRDVISAARFKTATTCDICAAFGVATVIPAGHASLTQRGVSACETCVASPLWVAVAGARPENVRDALTAGGFIA